MIDILTRPKFALAGLLGAVTAVTGLGMFAQDHLAFLFNRKACHDQEFEKVREANLPSTGQIGYDHANKMCTYSYFDKNGKVTVYT